MKCPNCYFIIEEDIPKCPACGVALNNNFEPDRDYTEDRSKLFKIEYYIKFIIKIVSSLLLLGLFIYILYFYYKDGHSNVVGLTALIGAIIVLMFFVLDLIRKFKKW